MFLIVTKLIFKFSKHVAFGGKYVAWKKARVLLTLHPSQACRSY